MLWLKQSTAVTVKIGPFLDETDGKTAETALTIAQADVRLSKNGGDIAQKNEATSCTHDELGIYDCPLDATDTGTLGRLQLWVHESGALPVWHEFMIVPANVWDSLFASDRLQVDVREFGDSTLALTTQMKADVDAECDEALTNYDPPTKAEMDAGHAALNDPTAGAIADAVWDEATADHQAAGSTGKALTDISASAIADQVWDEAAADHDTAGTMGKALADAGNDLGAGAITFTYTLTDADTGDAITTAKVWVTSDQAGNTVVASGTTDADGKVTFYLDAGTYYFWRSKVGWNFTNPDTETVA